MTTNFENWTEYDNWLIKNYSEFSIYKLEEKDGKIFIEYCDKTSGELQKIIEESKKK